MGRLIRLTEADSRVRPVHRARARCPNSLPNRLQVVLDACTANERATIAAVLPDTTVLDPFPQLRGRLLRAAERVLITAAERNQASVFERAMQVGRKLALPEPVLKGATQRYAAVRNIAAMEVAKQARRESLGLGALITPNEFLCPVTQDVMIDPVVASDGHSYERIAIQAILDRGCSDGGCALSPLTRAQLEPSLVSNINLRKRIREHDSEVDFVARQVIQSITKQGVSHSLSSPAEIGGNSMSSLCSPREVVAAP